MSYVEFLQTSLLCAPSPRESARFGIETDRITIGGNSRKAEPDIDRLAAAAKNLILQSSAPLKIVRFPSDLLPMMRTMVLVPGRIFPAGSLLYWEHMLDADPQLPLSGATQIMQYESRDLWLTDVLSIIEDSFDSYVNHYSVNPLIPSGVVKSGYAEWARSTISSHENIVIVVEDDWGKAVGVAVVRVIGDIWEIELASIVRDSQRQGFYLQLMTRILAEARDRKLSRIVISTQSHNIPVQRAWVRLGYSPTLSIETLHIVDDHLLNLAMMQND